VSSASRLSVWARKRKLLLPDSGRVTRRTTAFSASLPVSCTVGTGQVPEASATSCQASGSAVGGALHVWTVTAISPVRDRASRSSFGHHELVTAAACGQQRHAEFGTAGEPAGNLGGERCSRSRPRCANVLGVRGVVARARDLTVAALLVWRPRMRPIRAAFGAGARRYPCRRVGPGPRTRSGPSWAPRPGSSRSGYRWSSSGVNLGSTGAQPCGGAARPAAGPC
jgi:hypothetical protein